MPNHPFYTDSGSVAQTLDELERKLHELERQLSLDEASTAVPARTARAAIPVDPAQPRGHATRLDQWTSPPAPPPAAPAGDQLGALADQLDELERFRDQLQRTARELEDEYARLVGEAPVAPAQREEPRRAAVSEPPRPPAQRERAAADPYTGTVVLRAGPFAEIAALGAFEQALERMRGVKDVYVSGFEGRRAVIEIELAGPVPLLAELRAALSEPFTLRDATADGLTLDLEPSVPTA